MGHDPLAASIRSIVNEAEGPIHAVVDLLVFEWLAGMRDKAHAAFPNTIRQAALGVTPQEGVVLLVTLYDEGFTEPARVRVGSSEVRDASTVCMRAFSLIPKLFTAWGSIPLIPVLSSDPELYREIEGCKEAYVSPQEMCKFYLLHNHLKYPGQSSSWAEYESHKWITLERLYTLPHTSPL